MAETQQLSKYFAMKNLFKRKIYDLFNTFGANEVFFRSVENKFTPFFIKSKICFYFLQKLFKYCRIKYFF